MTELPPLDPSDADAPLHGVKVLEVAGELTGYAGRLLADLGAEVVLVRLSPAGGPDGFDPESWFLHRDKTEVRLDPTSAGGRDGLSRLVAGADVVLQSGGADAPAAPPGLDADAVHATNPRAVHAILTPFGLEGPAAEHASTDLVRLAAGGLLWLGGYPDAEPVAPFGDQSTIATAIYGAVAVLLALIAREADGRGDTIEVSSQEVITQALETSLPEFELLGTVRRRLGDVPREAGTGVFACADGFVSMVAGRLGTAGAWKRLTEWLQQEGVPGAEELAGLGWNTLPFRQRPESIARFSEIFGTFAATRAKADLYREAQHRSIALAPVNDLGDLLVDRQLAARGFFREGADPVTGTKTRFPAPPFRLSPPAGPPVDVHGDPGLSPAIAIVRRPI
jgi:benzylsuccinate CoA-transferase BbsE subunit